MDTCPAVLRRTIAAVQGEVQELGEPLRSRWFEPYAGHVSSDGVVTATPRAGQTRRPRQEETARKLLVAALDTLRSSSYADLTVRGVAARANVAPATAYTYFASKNHLVAEVYLDLVRQVGYFTDVNESRLSRVQQALRSLALVVADEPEVAAACTTALLSNDTAVRAVRERIGAEIHKRIKSAVGPDAGARTVDALEMSYFGALVQAGSGAFSYRQIADRLAYVAGLVLGPEVR